MNGATLLYALPLSGLYLLLIWEWCQNQKRVSFWLGWGIVLIHSSLILNPALWKANGKTLLIGCVAGIISLLAALLFTQTRFGTHKKVSSGLRSHKTGKTSKEEGERAEPRLFALGAIAILQGINCSKEEFLWRFLATSPWGETGILLSTWFFTLSHFPTLHTPRQALEFFGFSAALGFLYLKTGSLLVVTFAHWIRNMGILLWRMQKT